MRKVFIFILVAVMVCISGCAKNEQDVDKPKEALFSGRSGFPLQYKVTLQMDDVSMVLALAKLEDCWLWGEFREEDNFMYVSMIISQDANENYMVGPNGSVLYKMPGNAAYGLLNHIADTDFVGFIQQEMLSNEKVSDTEYEIKVPMQVFKEYLLTTFFIVDKAVEIDLPSQSYYDEENHAFIAAFNLAQEQLMNPLGEDTIIKVQTSGDFAQKIEMSATLQEIQSELSIIIEYVEKPMITDLEVFDKTTAIEFQEFLEYLIEVTSAVNNGDVGTGESGNNASENIPDNSRETGTEEPDSSREVGTAKPDDANKADDEQPTNTVEIDEGTE